MAALDPSGGATLFHRHTRKEDVRRLQAAALLVGDGHLMVLDSHHRVDSFVQADLVVFRPLVAR